MRDMKKRKEYLNDYQNQWVANRRAKWLQENGLCKVCGSPDNLQMDHIDPKNKITHKVWSRNEEFRSIELKKCQVLCVKCHRLKSNKENSERLIGISRPDIQKITDEQIATVLKLVAEGLRVRWACAKVGVKYGTFSSMKSRGHRPHLFPGCATSRRNGC